MIRRTAWALLTNFNGSYFGLPFLAIFTAIALVAPSDRMSPYNLLMSFGFMAATLVGLLAGTTLTEIKVKPLSYVLPGQEKSLAPAVLLVGTALCLGYALLVLGRPLTVVSVPAWQQALGAFGFGLGLFTLVVAACVVTHDTAFISQVTVFPFLLLMGAFGNETIAAGWLSLNTVVAENAVVAVLFAAGGVMAVLHLLSDRTHSRRLCGAPFMPLKAYDNPFKIDVYRSRMKSSAFRPSVMTDSRPSPGGLVMTALSRRVVGTPWDYLVLETRAGATRWEFAVKVATLVLLIIVVGLNGPDSRAPNALFALFFLVAMVFVFFPPTFKARLSPMPPVSRRRHFKSFLAKGLSVYALTIVATLLFTLFARLVSETAIGSGFETLIAAASLPLRAVLVVAAAVPIMCWAFAKLRSAVGFLFFMIAFMVVIVLVANAAQEFLLAQSYPALLLGTAVCWLPFVLVARKRCLKDDLLLP
jgi:hypothetical protein